MATAGSWREKLLKPGATYRVRKPWSQSGSSVEVGELVEYDSCGYERYDNMTLFRFYQGGGLFSKKRELIWQLHDDEPESRVAEYFSEVK